MRKLALIRRCLITSAAALGMAAVVLPAGGTAQAVNIGTGYSQNFDAMGTGTALPTDWTVWNITGAHGTWNQNTGIPTSGVSGGTAVTTGSAMTDTSIVNGTKSGSTYYNMAHSTSTGDRVLSTSPTGDAGMAIQLSLTNNTGAAINSLLLSYDIVKFYDGTLQSSLTSGYPNNEELPGYQLFYQIGSGSWANVSALNPVSAADGIHPLVPVGTVNASGTNGPVDYNVTSINNAVVTLATGWQAGQTLTLRWMDDNAVNISNDQVIGLDNVNVTPTPVPAAMWLLGSGMAALVGLRKRTRKR